MMANQMQQPEETFTQRSQPQQHGAQSMQGGQQMGMRLEDVETPQQRAAVEDIARAVQVCEWCADQCIQEADPNMIECIRLCRDVSEIGRTTLSLLPRNSRHAQALLGTLEQAIQACGQECSQHPHGHCQECSQELSQAADSIQQFYGSFGQQSAPTGQQMGGFQ